MKLGELGEYGFHGLVLGMLGGAGCPVGPGDDAGCLPTDKGFVLLNIDGYSMSRSMLPWSTWYDVGWKAAVASMSDLVAKAARPAGVMVSLGLRAGDEVETALEIIRGVRDAAAHHGAVLLGGDTNSSEDRWIDVASIGFSEKPVPRSRARVGDIIAVTGLFGLTGAGLHSLRMGRVPRDWPEVLEATRRPRLPLFFVEWAEENGECVHAAVDVSDGLAASLYLLAKASGVDLVLEEIPIHPEARRYAEENGVDPLDLALYGGEEYEVVMAIDPQCELPRGLYVLGKAAGRGGRVLLGEKRVENRGWDQFAS